MRYIILIVVLASSLTTSAQVYKYTVVESSAAYTTENGEYIDASGWDKGSFLLAFDNKENRFTIYAQKESQYDIIKALPNPKTKDENEWYSWSCLDKDGVKCIVREVFYKNKKEEYTAALYVDYLYVTLAFRIKPKP